MGKIYEGDTKLNITQVCEKLGREINVDQAKVLDAHNTHNGTTKKALAHIVLDAYKYLPNTTEQDMLIRKLCKHLMEKYMKSTAESTESEVNAFNNLFVIIKEKAKED